MRAAVCDYKPMQQTRQKQEELLVSDVYEALLYEQCSCKILVTLIGCCIECGGTVETSHPDTKSSLPYFKNPVAAKDWVTAVSWIESVGWGRKSTLNTTKTVL